MANNTGGGRRNRLEVPGARTLMEQLKNEVAEELGIHNYDQLDKGDLPARIHGKIGGNMVRKMIEYAETHMADEGRAALNDVVSQQGPNQQDIDTVAEYANQVANTTSASNQQLH
jgi:hypothetical protein